MSEWGYEEFHSLYRKGELRYGKKLNKVRGTYVVPQRQYRKIIYDTEVTIGDSVGIVGAGFGYLGYQFWLREHPLWMTDTSSWIHEHKAYESPTEVVDQLLKLDITDASDRAALPFTPDWIITEDVVSVLQRTDRELFYAACDLIAPKKGVLHLVTDIEFMRLATVAAMFELELQTLTTWKDDHLKHEFLRKE